ncbi:Flp pilus assembly protein CpaB [Hungatella sp.]|uniref:Flp pilus assembly protein CpaB n=1 Tax=Hungatella sp. TaxID=2613924 RepID=UPI002A802783|nr:Flp pilus assembly protein CpaB [Hungatella sp.]
MKVNSRFLYGILSILLAAIIAFIAIPTVTRKTNSKVEIVRITTALDRGDPITAKDVELAEVGGFNLPDNVATKLEDVIGTYAASSLYPGDYILSGKVSSTPLSSDLTLNAIPDGMVAISITVQSLAAGLSDKLQSGDIIRLYHYNDLSGTLNVVQDIPELKFVKVLSVSDSKGLDIDYTKQPEEDEERLQTATLTVQATPEQAILLTQYENEGMLHVALISRGNEALAKELLNQQAEILTQLYENEDADELLNVPEETTGETTEESSAASEETTPETEPEQNRR